LIEKDIEDLANGDPIQLTIYLENKFPFVFPKVCIITNVKFVLNPDFYSHRSQIQQFLMVEIYYMKL